MIRVVLVEDHPLTRRGTRDLLRHVQDIAIVAETGQGDEALTLARQLRPDVVLLDIRLLPGPSGVDVARTLRHELPEIKVLILSGYAEETYVRRLSAIGVHGYALKSTLDDDLPAAVRAVHRGEQWFSPQIAAQIASRTRGTVSPASDVLSDRELEVLELVAQGQTNRAIAEVLSVTVTTVESHVHNLLAKLGAHSRTEAVARAVQQGFITLER